MTLARAAEGDGASPTGTGRALGLRRSSMTSLADRLEQRGLLRRVADAHDRRLVRLRATDKGQALLERTLGPFLERLRQLGDSLDYREREAVSSFLSELASLLAEQSSLISAAPAPGTPLGGAEPITPSAP